MMLDRAIAAAERTETARHLIDRSQAAAVDLVTLSALELCALDGPRQPMFDERVARAWTQLADRRRRKIIEEVTAGLLGRGLLVDDHPRPGAEDGGDYGLKPELGLMLAARCRPSFIVIAAGERVGLRPLSLFALGDRIRPVQGIVAEVPAALPGGNRNAGKLGPLGWIYRYVLVSPASAADLLARWTITPPAEPGGPVSTRYQVSAYRPDRQRPAGYHLGVRGDGAKAVVDRPGPGSAEWAGAEYDREGLSAIMLGLLEEAAR